MPVVPFVGPTYQMEARTFDHQRSVNLMPIVSETGTSKSVVALRSTVGKQLFTTLPKTPNRGSIESAGRFFAVGGDTLYEIDNTGTVTARGTLNSSVGLIDIEENPTQLMIIDGTDGYIFNKTTNTLTEITDVDFPVASDLTFQDGYFIVTEKDTAKFWISALNNGSSWDAADNTTVESSPDNLVGLKSDSSNLWLFGTKTTEVYRNTGDAIFPFGRIAGAVIETGCAAQRTIQEIDNRLFWLGQDENGDAIVWVSNGYSAQRVSTQAIERIIESAPDVSESSAWVYHERGHAFYVLQVAGLNTTLVYDVSTGLWHERVYRDPLSGMERRDLAITHVFVFNKHYVGSRLDGRIFEQSLDFYDDDGEPLIKERISPHYDEAKNLISHAKFELDMETGIGTQTGQGSDPQVMMQYSDDGGRTWSNELWRDLGRAGEYSTRVRWNKLGLSRDRLYKVRITDPVFVQINEAIVNGP